jgi:hypothetical protein
MIVYHKNNEIDREQWDNCIRNTPGAKPYAYSWYLDIMAPGWQALVDDDYDSVFPVPGYTRFGIQYITTPVLLQQLGAYSPENSSTKVIKEFLDYMPDFYKYIDLCVRQKIDENVYKVSERVNYELDLSRSYESIARNFSEHCRKNIHLSTGKKPEIVSDITTDEIINLSIQNNVNPLNGIKDRDYHRLKNLINFCLINKKGRIIGVRGKRKRPIFAIFIIEIRGITTTLFVVNTPQSLEKRIDYFVFNDLIKKMASTKTILDFAGSSLSSSVSFYESFGSDRVPFYRIYKNRLFWPLKMLK